MENYFILADLKILQSRPHALFLLLQLETFVILTKPSEFFGLRARQQKEQSQSVGEIKILFDSQGQYFFKNNIFMANTQEKPAICNLL